MNKKLLTQIKNEWQSNMWLFIELLLVSVVMWYVVDYIYIKATIYNLPRGFDITNCYLLSMGHLTEQSPDFVHDRSNNANSDDVKEIMERLRRHPDVEAVGLGHNAYPYNMSNSSNSFSYDTLSTGYLYRRTMTPGFIEVFRYQGMHGETPHELAEKLVKGAFMTSPDAFAGNNGCQIDQLINQPFYLYGDSTNPSRLATTYQPIRYDDFTDYENSRSVIEYLNWYDYDQYKELCIRVKEAHDAGFVDRFRADLDKQYRVGNIFISDVRSFKDIRHNYQEWQTSQLRNYLFGMAFLLLNIFIALLGTFWFRTQQRRGEIALHKSMGATKTHIFVRQLSEGLLILTLATIPAIVVDFNLAKAEINQWMNGTTLAAGRFLLTVLYTYLIIAVMIVIGVWIPARRAMKIQAAEALHAE